MKTSAPGRLSFSMYEFSASAPVRALTRLLNGLRIDSNLGRQEWDGYSMENLETFNYKWPDPPVERVGGDFFNGQQRPRLVLRVFRVHRGHSEPRRFGPRSPCLRRATFSASSSTGANSSISAAAVS